MRPTHIHCTVRACVCVCVCVCCVCCVCTEMLELTACVELNTFTMCVCSATTLVQTHTHSHTIYTMHTHAHTHTYNLCMYIRQCRLTGAASATVEDLRTQTSSGFQNAIKSKKVRTYSGRYTKPCLCMSVFVCVLCQCLVYARR